MTDLFKKRIDLNKVNFRKLSTLEIDEIISQMQKLSSEEREKVICKIFDDYKEHEVRTGALGYILNQFREDILAIFEKETKKG